MKTVLLALALIPLATACFNEEICDCGPAPAAPSEGEYASADQQESLTIDDDVVALRMTDGTTVRYRIKNTMIAEDRQHFCGPRPSGWGLRTFELSSSTTLTVRAQVGSRFIGHTDASISEGIRSKTTRAEDGSKIDVVIDLTSAPPLASFFYLSMTWSLETANGESAFEQPFISFERDLRCPNQSCMAVGPARLAPMIDCL
jgi:hypothetical protein